MTTAFKDRRRTIVNGLSGVAKMLVLVVGVPLALLRLWVLTPVNTSILQVHTFETVRIWARLFLLTIVVLWLVATVRLLREILLAMLHHQERPGGSWSIRWATQIAGLLLLASTASVLSGHLSSAKGSPASFIQNTQQPNNKALVSSGHQIDTTEDCSVVTSRPEPATNDQTFLETDLRVGLTPIRGTESKSPHDSAYTRWCFGDPNPTGANLDLASTRDEQHSLHDLWTALELVGVGALIVGALARRLRLLRKLHASTRMPLERVGAGLPRVAKTGAFLRSFCESPVIDWLEIANRLLWKVLRERHREFVVPDIRLVRCGKDGVEFLLASPLDHAPWPFESTTGGYWWKLTPPSSLSEWQSETANYGRYLPNLVPIGDDSSATYLVPVGPTRCLGILGDDQSVDSALRAMVLGLRTLPWADELEIELLGPRVPSPSERSFHLHGSNATILKDLSHSPRHLPRERLGSDWSREPLVVLGREALSSSLEIVLEELSLTVGVIAAGVSGTETLVLEDGRAILSPYGIELNAPLLNEEIGDLVDTLLAHAGSPPSNEPARITPPPNDFSQENLDASISTGLRLLCARPYLEHLAISHPEPLRTRVTELVAYLALHHRLATIDEIGADLFPLSRVIPRARVIRLCSAARHALGQASDGRNLLSVSQDGFVRLDPSLTTDWHRFKQAAQQAVTLAPAEALNLLRGVLEFVEGDPFSRVRIGFAWLIASGEVEEMQETVIDAAHHFASLSLAMGQDAQAMWAIDQGCLVSMNSEILVRDTMAICDARGDSEGLEAVYSSLERDLLNFNAEPSLETTELFQSLRTNLGKHHVTSATTKTPQLPES